MFVRQVEDHGLRADHLLAHQAGNVRHRVVAPRAAPTAPIRTATTTPIRTTTTTAVRTAAAWAIRAPRPSDSCAAGGAHGGGIGEREAGVRPVAHYPVEMAEDDPVGDTVVRQKGAPHLGLVFAAGDRTTKRPRLQRNNRRLNINYRGMKIN